MSPFAASTVNSAIPASASALPNPVAAASSVSSPAASTARTVASAKALMFSSGMSTHDATCLAARSCTPRERVRETGEIRRGTWKIKGDGSTPRGGADALCVGAHPELHVCFLFLCALLSSRRKERHEWKRLRLTSATLDAVG